MRKLLGNYRINSVLSTLFQGTPKVSAIHLKPDNTVKFLKLNHEKEKKTKQNNEIKKQKERKKEKALLETTRQRQRITKEKLQKTLN